VWFLWVVDGTLVAQRLDLERKVLTGDPVTLADPVTVDVRTATGALSVSAAGLVAYRAGGGATSQRQLTWFDRSGKALGVLGAADNSELNGSGLSPDGRRAVVSRTVQGNADLWLLAGTRTSRFTFAASLDLFGTNKIATIDPGTLEIVEYALPAGARPRRIAVTPDDMIWYTDYARGFLGRLDPRTGDVTEFASPGGRTSQPYGMTSTSDGAIWYSESGVEPNTVVRFNPPDGSMQRWPIPSGGGVVRHMVTAPNDDVWLACSGVDRLARVRVVSRGGG